MMRTSASRACSVKQVWRIYVSLERIDYLRFSRAVINNAGIFLTWCRRWPGFTQEDLLQRSLANRVSQFVYVSPQEK